MFAALRTPLAAAALLFAFGAVSAAPLVALACPMAAPPTAEALPPCHGDATDAPVDAPMLCCLAAPTDAATTLASPVVPNVPAHALVVSFVDAPTAHVPVPNAPPQSLRAPPPGPSLHLTTRLLI